MPPKRSCSTLSTFSTSCAHVKDPTTLEERSPKRVRQDTDTAPFSSHATPMDTSPSAAAAPPSSSSPTSSSPGPREETATEGNEAWRKSWPPPAQFPREDWKSACWGVPNLSVDYVTREVFQLSGKFASVAVRQALDGVLPWSHVGANGIYLALVDLMLQCRDHLRTETLFASIRRGVDPNENPPLTYTQWRKICDEEMERIFGLAILPERAMRGITLAESKLYSTAAILAGFTLRADATTPPARGDYYSVPSSFLGQYDATREQLERYGMCVVSGSIPLNTNEGDTLRKVANVQKRGVVDPQATRPLGLRGMPLSSPVAIAEGPIPDTNSSVTRLPIRRFVPGE